MRKCSKTRPLRRLTAQMNNSAVFAAAVARRAYGRQRDCMEHAESLHVLSSSVISCVTTLEASVTTLSFPVRRFRNGSGSPYGRVSRCSVSGLRITTATLWARFLRNSSPSLSVASCVTTAKATAEAARTPTRQGLPTQPPEPCHYNRL